MWSRKTRPKAPVALVGGDQHQAEIGVVRLGPAEGEVGDGVEPGAGEEAEFQARRRIAAGRRVGEEFLHQRVVGGKAGFKVDVVRGAVVEGADGGAVGFGRRGGGSGSCRIGDGRDLEFGPARGARPGDRVADLRAHERAGEGRMRGDAADAGVGLILAGDLVAVLGAVFVDHRHGRAEGDLVARLGGRVDGDGGAQARLEIADVALGGGLGQAVEPVGAGAQAGKLGLRRGKTGAQGWRGRAG